MTITEVTIRSLTLTPKEEMVIQHRFGIGLEHDFTLREVEEKMALSYERVRQIETEALRKLQQTCGDTLADFSERSREDQPNCPDRSDRADLQGCLSGKRQ